MTARAAPSSQAIALYRCDRLPLTQLIRPSACATHKARLARAKRAPASNLPARLDLDFFAACAGCPGVLQVSGGHVAKTIATGELATPSEVQSSPGAKRRTIRPRSYSPRPETAEPTPTPSLRPVAPPANPTPKDPHPLHPDEVLLRDVAAEVGMTRAGVLLAMQLRGVTARKVLLERKLHNAYRRADVEAWREWRERPKSGRPKLPPGRARDAVVMIRMREADHEKLQQAAKVAGESLSGWARRVLLGAAE